MTPEQYRGLCARLENIELAVRGQAAKPILAEASAAQLQTCNCGTLEPHEVVFEGKRIKEFRHKPEADCPKCGGKGVR